LREEKERRLSKGKNAQGGPIASLFTLVTTIEKKLLRRGGKKKFFCHFFKRSWKEKEGGEKNP